MQTPANQTKHQEQTPRYSQAPNLAEQLRAIAQEHITITNIIVRIAETDQDPDHLALDAWARATETLENNGLMTPAIRAQADFAILQLQATPNQDPTKRAHQSAMNALATLLHTQASALETQANPNHHNPLHFDYREPAASFRYPVAFAEDTPQIAQTTWFTHLSRQFPPDSHFRMFISAELSAKQIEQITGSTDVTSVLGLINEYEDGVEIYRVNDARSIIQDLANAIGATTNQTWKPIPLSRLDTAAQAAALRTTWAVADDQWNILKDCVDTDFIRRYRPLIELFLHHE